jgi:hypothetical protein
MLCTPATLLQDARPLFTGGRDLSILKSAESYDPATNIWTTTGSLNTERESHTATLMPNGQVLVAGGTGPILQVSRYSTLAWDLIRCDGLVLTRSPHLDLSPAKLPALPAAGAAQQLTIYVRRGKSGDAGCVWGELKRRRPPLAGSQIYPHHTQQFHELTVAISAPKGPRRHAWQQRAGGACGELVTK